MCTNGTRSNGTVTKSVVINTATLETFGVPQRHEHEWHSNQTQEKKIQIACIQNSFIQNKKKKKWDAHKKLISWAKLELLIHYCTTTKTLYYFTNILIARIRRRYLCKSKFLS